MAKRALFLNLLIFLCARALAQDNGVALFDNDWRFFRGGAQRAEQPNFDDSKWRKIDLPHDWSIEDLPGTTSPFNPGAISQVGGGFTTGGTGWYRKSFTVPAVSKGKRIIIQFDGVYMNATVFVNGRDIGNHPYGYTSFWYDITDKIKFGAANTVAVEVKNEGQNSRWYSGSGIYRHVWLKTADPVHIAQWGTFITTPEVNNAKATANIRTKVINEGKNDVLVKCVTRITDQTGKEAATLEKEEKVRSGASIEFTGDATINNPLLWSCESPALYTAHTQLYYDGKLADLQKTVFGIRTISFDAENGFRLNGKVVKLKGGCFHNDNGPLGSKAYDRAEERKVQLLKASGFNAIRCSHNPPSPAFLAECDRQGMLVMDEAFDCWKYGKNAYDYHLYFNDWWKRDIESMVLRDRDHPSIIMWSIGNEIPERASAEGAQTAKMLAGYIKELDNTRAITSAVNNLSPDKDPYFAALDVGGYNYPVSDDGTSKNPYDEDHKRLPNRIMVGTESYPLTAFGSWMNVLDRPYVIGDFVWTAWDYIGEASIGWLGYEQEASFYPWNLAWCGDIDICGWKRPQSYYRDALWKSDQLAIFVTPPKPSFPLNPIIEPWSKWNWLDAVDDWNWKGFENRPITVNVYSSCQEVELFLNNRSLGRKPTNRATKFTAAWDVPYQPGKLVAVGYDGNKKVNTAVLATASAPAAIQLTADRNTITANKQDLCYVTIRLTDAKGNLDPRADNMLKFKVDGPGTIAGVGNADPRSTESYQRPQRRAWRGKCMLVIKSVAEPGNITLKVSADGLPEKNLVIRAR